MGIPSTFLSKKKQNFNNQTVPCINEYEHLHLIIDSRLSFTKHLTEEFGIIHCLSFYGNLDTLVQIYKLFVRSHFDCCGVIFYVAQKSSIFYSFINLYSLMNSLVCLFGLLEIQISHPFYIYFNL